MRWFNRLSHPLQSRLWIPALTYNLAGADWLEYVLSPRFWWQSFLRHKGLFWLIFTSVVLLFLLFGLFTDTQYQAEATVEVAVQGEGNGADTAISDLGYSALLQGKIQALKSRQLANEVIQALDLRSRLVQTAKARNGPFSGIKYKWQTLKNSLFDSEYIAPTADEEIIDAFLKGLSVKQVSNSHLLRVKYVFSDRELSAQIVNVLLSRHINKTQELSKADISLEPNNKDLHEAAEQLKKSEQAYYDYVAEHGLTGAEFAAGSALAKRINDLQQTIAIKEKNRDEVVLEMEQIKRTGRSDHLEHEQIIAALRDELQQFRLLIRSRTRSTDSLPDVSTLRKRVIELQDQLESQVMSRFESLETQKKLLDERISKLNQDLSGVESQVQQTHEHSATHNALLREYELDKSQYEQLWKESRNGKPKQQIHQLRLNILDPATPQHQRGPLSFWQRLLMGSVLGAFLGALAVILREALRSPVQSQAQLGRVADLPVLGVIPYLKEKAPAHLALAGVRDQASPFTEAYRIASTNIQFAAKANETVSLLITSINPAEGKSTTSVNLALAKSLMGQKTLLIDADLRRPSVHKKMGLRLANGLSEYLASKADIAQVTQNYPDMQNAYVISSGSPIEDPIQGLSNVRMSRLLLLAKKHFDFTILDAPPIRGFADTLLLASMVDHVILIVEEGGNTISQLQSSIARLQKIRQNVLGVVMVKSSEGEVDEEYYSQYQARDVKAPTSPPPPKIKAAAVVAPAENVKKKWGFNLLLRGRKQA